MTYKAIRNLNGSLIYMVSSQEEADNNSHIECFVGSGNDINLRLEKNRADYLVQESYRFSISKEVVDGNNTTWCLADLENDPDNGSYLVFNHFTGCYETSNSLSDAKNRLEQLKIETLTLAGFDEILDIEFLPEPINVPKPLSIPVAEL